MKANSRVKPKSPPKQPDKPVRRDEHQKAMVDEFEREDMGIAAKE